MKQIVITLFLVLFTSSVYAGSCSMMAKSIDDKIAVMFKIHCTVEAALIKFIEGTEVSQPIMDEVMGSYMIYDLTKVKEG